MMPIYVSNDDSISLTRDPAVSAEAVSITATTYRAVVGGSFTIQIPNSITAGTLTIQGNNSNPWLKNSFNGRNGTGVPDPSFSSNWQSISTMTNNFIAISNIPVRWVRLSGAGVTGAGFVAYIWTNDGVHQ